MAVKELIRGAGIVDPGGIYNPEPGTYYPTGINPTQAQNETEAPTLKEELTELATLWKEVAELAPQAGIAGLEELVTNAERLTATSEEKIQQARSRAQQAVDNANAMLDEYEETGAREFFEDAKAWYGVAERLVGLVAVVIGNGKAALAGLRSRLAKMQAVANEEERAALKEWALQLEEYRQSLVSNEGEIYGFIESYFGESAAKAWQKLVDGAARGLKAIGYTLLVVGGAAVLVPAIVWGVKRLIR